jgi:predicted dehydrogenase
MITVAILGAGIGREHLAAYRELRGAFHVTRVIDQDLARIEDIREGDDFVASAAIEDALIDPDIDVIDVCLPPHLHVLITLKALEAGKHVICEKPLATSMADADAIKDAAEAAGKQVFPVFQYRWGPSLAKLRHMMAADLTGQVQTATVETHWSRGSEYYASEWRGTWAGERGGAVLGHAIHNHDLLTHIAGEIAALSAMTTTRVNDIETEDCAALSFEMRSGALCSSNITLGAARDETRLRFVFEHLTATSDTEPYAPGAQAWTFTARDPKQQVEIDAVLAQTPKEAVGFVGLFTEIGKALNGKLNSVVTLKDGLASVELVTAIYHAARTGTRVALPLGLDHPLRKGWLP